jgi:type I restriction enzyme S subunit
MSLSELGSLFGGLSGKSKADFGHGGSRFVSYSNVFNHISVDLNSPDYVQIDQGERQNRLRRGDILFTGSSETPDEVAMSSVVTSELHEPLYLNSFTIGFRLTDPVILDSDFSKHLFRSSPMREQLVRTANGVTRFNVSKPSLYKIKVPVPQMHEQKHIAATLDKFDSLVNDLSSGLPAEIAARRRQHEFYRDRLLSFKELAI